jgi:biopolymer transport protein ExbB
MVLAEASSTSIDSLVALLRAGGPIVLVQLVLSVIAGAFVIERLVALRRGRIVPGGLARRSDELWTQGRLPDIEALCDRNPSTLARMIQAILDHRSDAPADVASIVTEVGRPEMRRELLRCYPIVVIATIQPMLGLLGTVWGMILAFGKVSQAGTMGNASLLADEISLALVTTAVGLALAIPLMLLYHFIKARTHALAIELESVAGRMIRTWLRRAPADHRDIAVRSV